MTEKIKSVAGKYEVSAKLGSGAFGEVHLGFEQETRQEVAIKLEMSKSKHPQVAHEARLYKMLEDGLGTPKVHWIGPVGEY